ncbi:hypothetical protein ACLB2K_062839 [Fragaria x ananassa]
MRHRRHLRLILTIPTRRHYATKYTAKVTSTSPTGRTLSVEVTPPPPLPTDIRGYTLPRRDLVCKATQIILHQSRSATSDPFLDLADYLSSLSVSLTPAEASEILKSLNDADLALKFFRFCPSLSPKFQHDAFTCNRILLILSKSAAPARFYLARSTVSDMHRSNIRGNTSTVNLLIGLFGSSDDLETTMELVKKWSLKMNSYTYKCLVQAFLRSYDTAKAFLCYMELRRHYYKLDIYCYNMLLHALALAKDEKVEQAYKVFEDMKKKHCGPDEFTYTIMIRMSGKLGKGEESLVFFQGVKCTNSV